MFDFNSIEITKKGLKEAEAGNLNEALALFSKATDASFHIRPKRMRIKIGLEILTIQNLCEAVKSINEEDFVAGNHKFTNYKTFLDNYTEICKTNSNDVPSVGCKYFIEKINGLTKLYKDQIDLLSTT